MRVLAGLGQHAVQGQDKSEKATAHSARRGDIRFVDRVGHRIVQVSALQGEKSIGNQALDRLDDDIGVRQR